LITFGKLYFESVSAECQQNTEIREWMCKKSGADLKKSRLGIMYFHHMIILLPITKRHEQQIKSYHRYQKAIIQISSFMKLANTIKEKKCWNNYHNKRCIYTISA